MKLPRSTRSQQEALVDRIVGVGVSRRQIAEAAGVDASMVSKWTTEGDDGRMMSALELMRLADTFGWDTVFGPSARAAGFRIEDIANDDPGAVTLVDVSAAAGRLLSACSAAMDPRGDGGAAITPSEWREHAMSDQLAQLRAVVSALEAMEPGVRSAS